MIELSQREMTFRVYRYDPEIDDEPYMQAYQLEVSQLASPMLLGALEALKETQDPTLTFRRSCREGVCGSDGMNINGKNGLACITKLVDLPDEVVIQPLPGLPVIKDLIVDFDDFIEQYGSVKPYLQHQGKMPEKEFLQSPAERAKLDGLYECILCGCCSSACPSYWWNPDKFAGPATLLASYRFVSDSRDDQKDKRLSDLKDPYKVFRCRSIMNCTYVCPKGLNPTRAIGKLRQEMLSHGDST